MKTVAPGSVVKAHFKGYLDDGEVFDSTEGLDPVVLKIGAGLLIKGFEENLVGMREGERKTFTLSPADAYGLRDESLVKSFPRSALPSDYEPSVGDILAAEIAKGLERPVRVKHANTEQIVVDLNHPLAGKDLTYEVEIVEIEPAPEVK